MGICFKPTIQAAKTQQTGKPRQDIERREAWNLVPLITWK
jgi:hypothetical protein